MAKKKIDDSKTNLIAERMDQKKESIMQAALQLFATHGFNATAVGILADKAGVAAGTIYRYFDNKESLLNELFITHKKNFLKAVQENFPAQVSSREQFHWLWAALYKFSEENDRSFAFLELQHHANYLNSLSLEAEEEFLAHFRRFIDLAKKEGAAKDVDTDLLVCMILGAFTNLVKQHQLRRIKLTPQAVRQAGAACWDLVST